MTPPNLIIDFDEVLKEVIVPFFKDLGFKGKAHHFARGTNDIVQCFNVQKGSWNPYNDTLSFTFNLGFYNETIRTLSWGQVIATDFPKTTDCFIQNRLGTFTHNRDHWYELSRRMDSSIVKEQVKDDLEKHLKPLFETYQSLIDLKKYPDKNTGFLLSPYGKIVFLMMTGQTEQGIQFLKKQYKIALTPQTRTEIINYPDGRREEKVSKPMINQHYVDHIERLAKHYDIEL